MKVETITFSFGQVFSCVHACKREGGGGMLCAGGMTQADLIALTK